jgi:hypothetical protein
MIGDLPHDPKMGTCQIAFRAVVLIALSACGFSTSGSTKLRRSASTSQNAEKAYRSDTMAFIETGKIRVGIDLAKGGAISYLSMASSNENLINNHDLGRQVQASFYSGPSPYGHASSAWKGWNWNPIESGDVYGHAAKVDSLKIAGNVVYTRSNPYQWALDGVKCECSIESWVRASGNVATVHIRLTNHRRDLAQYPASDQEVPAVYTTGRLRHVVSYTGDHPFTQEAATDVPATFPWTRWSATEGWSALVNDHGWGLGVVSPESEEFGGGFFGPAKDGSSADAQTGFVRPGFDEILDHNIVYEYSYTMVLGTVAEIRAVAAHVHGADRRPDFTFNKSREHWIYRNAADKGWPIRGYLDIKTGSADPQMIAPPRLFAAATVNSIYVRAAFLGQAGNAQLFWATRSDPMFSESKSVTVPVVTDGNWHVYRMDVAANPAWSGAITALRFDPPPGGKAGSALIASVSWRPPAERGM